jgi:glutathione S-transferase
LQKTSKKGVTMYQLFGFTTQNTMKVLYCLEELGVDYEFNFVNLFKGEQNSEEILKLNPFHKVPILKHGDFSMFESNAICRYICEQEKSELFPTEQKS